MPKNIVICCDGTGNEYREPATNVLRLYSMLPRAGMDERDRSDQITYYDPGVGTLGVPFALTRFGKAVTKALGLGFGLGITQNISDAYQKGNWDTSPFFYRDSIHLTRPPLAG